MVFCSRHAGTAASVGCCVRSGETTPENNGMAEKFDPAPTDKHADKPKERSIADKKADGKLKKGLEDSFPASDPPSNTQPSKIGDDAG